MVRISLRLCFCLAVLPAVACGELVVDWTSEPIEPDGAYSYTFTNNSRGDHSLYTLSEVLAPFALPQDDYNLNIEFSHFWQIGFTQADTDGDGTEENCVRLWTRFSQCRLEQGEHVIWTGATDAEHFVQRTVLYTFRNTLGEPFSFENTVLLPATQEMVRTPGDADGDGEVTFDDAWILLGNYPLDAGATWEQGDFNGDSRVDADDADLLMQNYQGESVTELQGMLSGVPEPATLVLLAVGGAAVLSRRRR
jgi:hypothetical protein